MIGATRQKASKYLAKKLDMPVYVFYTALLISNLLVGIITLRLFETVKPAIEFIGIPVYITTNGATESPTVQTNKPAKAKNQKIR